MRAVSEMGLLADSQEGGGKGSSWVGGGVINSLIRRKQVDSVHASSSGHQLAKALSVPHLIAIGNSLSDPKKIQSTPHNGAAGPRSKPHIPPLGSETRGFGQKHDATVDIPLDTLNVDSKSKEKELASWEADLKRREKGSSDGPEQYVAIMNSIFSAQRSMEEEETTFKLANNDPKEIQLFYQQFYEENIIGAEH
ncbi:hypothetical protein CMV_027642 [Castanea mollissima]|uniref:Uncharacterized protein n=1 Tax=Castanea mollissima TaxID=60419 RepID=A0A8J4VCZ4_9ROSI|nr:hypothetical protein CMV_027642 [Castanea mollissima]